MRELREVFFVDGVRTAFGKAGPKGQFWRTRADDMAVKAVRELLRRNPAVPPGRIGDVVLAATAQVGDQGLTLGRDVALLAGIPQTVPGFAVDRMCAGAMTALTAAAGEIAFGAADIALAGGVEPHLMGIGPVPATKRVLEQAGITLDDVDLFELNEPFAVQVLTWCDELGVPANDPRLNPYGGAIACGHPLAATGVRLVAQLAYGLHERGGRYGLTALCIGMGMGAAILWENVG